MSSIPDDNTSTTNSDPSTSARPPVVPETCANCGRTFIGDYCPGCGQRAEPAISILHILGGFVRELVDTERGLWRTFRDLTLRPGTAVKDYLTGTRRPFTSPGRYLLVGALVVTVLAATLEEIGAPASNIGRLAVIAANGFGDGVQDPGHTAPLEGTAWKAATQDLEQFGAYPALVLMLIAGLVGVLYWALFRRSMTFPAEAFAVATYATAHTVVLYQSTDFVFELLVHYGALETQASLVFERASEAILFVYPCVLTYGCFGSSVWNGVKGSLGFLWGYIEAPLVALAGLAGYAEWLAWTNPDAYSGDGPGAAITGFFFAVLLLVHGAFKLYARYRYGGHSE